MYTYEFLHYHRLEKEVEEVLMTITYNEEQKKVYSPRIADLILRVCSEIEFLAKEIYFREGGPETDPEKVKFDKDGLELINDKIGLNRLILFTSELNKTQNKRLMPFVGFKKTTNAWLNSYQSIKHYKYNNLEKASLENLVTSLAALYILNILNLIDGVYMIYHGDYRKQLELKHLNFDSVLFQPTLKQPDDTKVNDSFDLFSIEGNLPEPKGDYFVKQMIYELQMNNDPSYIEALNSKKIDELMFSKFVYTLKINSKDITQKII